MRLFLFSDQNKLLIQRHNNWTINPSPHLCYFVHHFNPANTIPYEQRCTNHSSKFQKTACTFFVLLLRHPSFHRLVLKQLLPLLMNISQWTLHRRTFLLSVSLHGFLNYHLFFFSSHRDCFFFHFFPRPVENILVICYFIFIFRWWFSSDFRIKDSL